ncbi:hypothetical protein JJ691_18520 [Kutzneria sp. CA-103260]|nr:hypothetical protein JJ691_18520 [Kutzneria sp. CA-103260]
MVVLPAWIQDRDGAKRLLLELHHRQHPLLSTTRRRTRHLFADGGFAGALLEWARPGGTSLIASRIRSCSALSRRRLCPVCDRFLTVPHIGRPGGPA